MFLVSGCTSVYGESGGEEFADGDEQACVEAYDSMNAVGNLMDTRLNASSLATLQRAGSDIAAAAEYADSDVKASLDALVTVIDKATVGQTFSRWPRLTQAFAACQA